MGSQSLTDLAVVSGEMQTCGILACMELCILCIQCILVKIREGHLFPVMQTNQVDVKKNPRTHATPGQMLESFYALSGPSLIGEMSTMMNPLLLKADQNCMFHLSGSPSPCLFSYLKQSQNPA